MPVLTLEDGTLITTDYYEVVTPEVAERLKTQQQEVVAQTQATLEAQQAKLEELEALEVTE